MNNPAFSIYDASAGSGKTYALVKEYLKIILLSNKNDAYKNILAITFTNKAVHEMKSRVLDNLSEFAKDNPSEKAQQLMYDIRSETKLNLHEIQDKAKKIIKNIIHNYATFDISTIDKFTHKVIRAFAHDLGLSITFEVSLDTENLLAEAVDTLIARAGNEEENELTKLLVDFTMEKTDDDKSWDISREIMETGRLILNENNREEIVHFNSKSITEFIQIKSKLVDLSQQLEAETIKLASEAMELIQKNNIDLKSFPYETFPKHLNFIITKDERANNHKFLEFDDIKIKDKALDKSIIESIIPELLAILKLIYAKFEKKNFYQAFLKNITPLSLLNTVSQELAKIQKEQNILSIAEFNKLINEQIQNQPAPFIYERLGEKYRHFFIDEFQDTSEMQWQNLIPLIDNATSSMIDNQKGTVMLVGDPKQSIYRWRGGKAEQFIALSKNANPFNNPEKEIFSLDTNYRSYSEIINFNNNFFQFLSKEFKNEDYKDLYSNHSHQKNNDKKGGFISITFIPKTETIEESDLEENNDKNKPYLMATFQKIVEVKSKGFSNKDIVILTRKKAQGTAIANYLTEKGISIISSESLLIGASSEVQCIIHILRYLKSNNDLESKAKFLYYLAKNWQDKLPIHNFISSGMDCKQENEFQDWLAQFGLDFSFENCRKKSLYEATEIIISKVIPILKQNAYTQYFLDIVLERDIKNQAGISDFLYYWDKNSERLSIPSPEGNDAVRIMTIHKSKGLEFPVVIFPFADEDFNRTPKSKIWLNADEEAIGLPKVLVDNTRSVKNFGNDASVIYEQKEQEDLLDTINVMYVALTRAEEQLHVISKLVSKNSKGEYPNNMATFFIEFLQNNFNDEKLEYHFGSSERISSNNKAEKEVQIIPKVASKLNPKHIKIAQRESIMWNTKQQNAIEYGNAIHEILSLIKIQSDIDFAITKAIENGLIVSNQKEEVLQTINEIVKHHELVDFFNENNKILNEQTIIQKEGNLVKPDRMVINASNEIYLLDYKTGSHLPKHKQQIENYQNAIENMGFKVVKKALIYIGEEINIVNL